MKQRLSQLFMSKEQTIYLWFLFFSCIIYGMFASFFSFYQISLGTRYYSALISLGCVIGVVHAYVSADVKKKRWVFGHFKIIDLSESIFFTITEMTFLVIYIKMFGFGKLNIEDLKSAIADSTSYKILHMFFFWSVFYRIVNAIISIVLPGIGDVFEQSLYKNQIDYQNHSNAEQMMSCLGAAIGAGACWLIGDFFVERPWIVFLLVFWDWVTLYSRWQFYFKPSNYSIIKRNFAKDSGEKMRKLYKDKMLNKGL